MTTWTDYRTKLTAGRGGTCGEDGTAERYGDLAAEYAALGAGPAIVDRANRAIVEVTGADRASWLHNLTTNVVKTLSPGDGKYAFATNVPGRILFDLNIIVRPDLIRLDIDRCFLEDAIAHFNKYIIMEDVTLCNRSDDFVILGISGDRASDVATTLGASQMTAMADINSVEVELSGVTCLLVKNNFCGPSGFELHVPSDSAIDAWKAMVDPDGPFRVTPAGSKAVQVRRIEAAIPWSGAEITGKYLPAETMQFDRAVSFQKGCYLGQEVIERMRTREKLARRLVQLEIAGESTPVFADAIVYKDANVGTITSAVRSLATGQPLALGYVKTAASEPGTTVAIRTESGDLDATVSAAPTSVPASA